MKSILALLSITCLLFSCIQSENKTEKMNSNKNSKTNESKAVEKTENSIPDYERTCIIPNHRYLIKEKIKWDKENENLNQNKQEDETDYSFPKKVGVDMLDTMFILTEKKLILIRGLYSYFKDDTIRMPESGEFNINFKVMDKTDYQIGITKNIVFNKTKYVLHDKVEYQWWCLIFDKLDTNKDNSIKVSGP